MGRVINTILFLALCLAGVGFFRGWFSLSSQTDPETEKVNVNLTIDTTKVKADTEFLREKAAEITNKPADSPITAEKPAEVEKPSP